MLTTTAVSLFLLAMAAVLSPAAAQHCLATYRLRNPNHTTCRQRPSWCRIKDSGVSMEQRYLILKLHNQFRSQTTLGRLPGFPAAADMQELLWDNELAHVAQAHAYICTKADGDQKHDRVEDRFTSRFPKTGQNLAWEGQPEYTPGPNWTWVMDHWFTQEYARYPPEKVAHFTPMEGVKIGHFSQVIWAQTRYVGCGYVYYRVDAKVFRHIKQYTCNYGPSGNYVGWPIYKEGPTCSACPKNGQCKMATGLCDDSAAGPPRFKRPRKIRRPTTPSQGHLSTQPPRQTCPPCPCLPSTPNVYQAPASRYPGYRYPTPYTSQRRYPPNPQDPAPRRYPLSYDPRLRDGLPRCEDVEGYKPGEPGQPACVENDDNGGLRSVDVSDGAHSGRPGRDAAIWQYFVAGSVTGLAMMVPLGVFLVFWRFTGSTDGAGKSCRPR
ncbi:hypothetical protein HPB49_012469 [Dermacentor silvarum]|uniref:Uncharacterized protein n=1 Tax=Dermacentor silvarum TaxID=543639 RepID=A0ACB8D563_DERSI|nr:cysteine-rich venom protein-like [Dermacentor silvarum]KAH7959614.1 hypothetical protein HPB49_012469 [Dermacentor silvarum]